MQLRGTRVGTAGRTTWVSLLVVLLVSFWSAGSACEVACDLARASSCCAADGSSQSAMPGMMQRADLAAMLVMPRAAACAHAVCAPLPALTAERGAAFAYAAPRVEAVLVSVALIVPGGEASSAAVRGPPRIGAGSPVSLHILVRV